MRLLPQMSQAPQTLCLLISLMLLLLRDFMMYSRRLKIVRHFLRRSRRSFILISNLIIILSIALSFKTRAQCSLSKIIIAWCTRQALSLTSCKATAITRSLFISTRRSCRYLTFTQISKLITSPQCKIIMMWRMRFSTRNKRLSQIKLSINTLCCSKTRIILSISLYRRKSTPSLWAFNHFMTIMPITSTATQRPTLCWVIDGARLRTLC